MLFILPALTLLPLVAIYLSVTSSIGASGPFSHGPLAAFSSWFKLPISPPSYQSLHPIASPSVLFIASSDPAETSLPPAAVLESTPPSPTVPITVSVSPRRDDDKMLFLQASTLQLQLLRASDLLLKTMEANPGTLVSLPPPPPLPPRPVAQLLIDPPPTLSPSPTSLTDDRRSTPPKDQAYQSSKEVKPATSARMSWSEHMQLKGCFFDDPRACPRTSTLDGLLESLVDRANIILVFVVAMVCAIVFSAIGTTPYSSESIGIQPIIPHTLAVPTGCSASQQVLDASRPQQEHVTVPSRRLVTYCDVAVQTEAYSASVYDVSPSVPDASPTYTEDGREAAFDVRLTPGVSTPALGRRQASVVQASDSAIMASSPTGHSRSALSSIITSSASSEESALFSDACISSSFSSQSLGLPAIHVNDADSPLESSADDFTAELHARLSDLPRCHEDSDESSLTPPPASPVSTAPPSPIPSESLSLKIPHWSEDLIYNPEYLRMHGLGPDGLAPSLSRRSSMEVLYRYFEGDCDSVPPVTSTPHESSTLLGRRFADDGLSSSAFDFSPVLASATIPPKSHPSHLRRSGGHCSSSFSFIFYPPYKRRKLEDDDEEEDTSYSVGNFAGLDSDSQTVVWNDNSADSSMDLTNVLDDVVKNSSNAPSEPPVTHNSDHVVIPDIHIIADSPPPTPKRSNMEDFDLSGIDDDPPLSSTPVKSGTSSDAFRELSIASIKSTGNSSGLFDGSSPNGPLLLFGTSNLGLSTSSLDLARHLPPLTSSYCSSYSRAGPDLNLSVSNPASPPPSLESSIVSQMHHHRLLTSNSSSSSDDHGRHIPPTWSFDLGAYRHPPPLSTTDSFFIGSCQSSTSSTASVHPYTPPVPESISDRVALVAADEYGIDTPSLSDSVIDPAGEVADEELGSGPIDDLLDLASSFRLAGLPQLDDDYLLDQTFEVELAGGDDLGFEPLDESEDVTPPLSPNADFDGGDEQFNAVTSLTQASGPVEESQEDVSSASINFSCGEASQLLNQTFGSELDGLDLDLSFVLAGVTDLDGECLLNQTFEKELADCNEFGFDPLDESELASPLLPPGAVSDGVDERCSLAQSQETSGPIGEAQEDVSSASINFSCGDASLLMNQTFASELEGSESAFPEIMAASSPDPTREETLPSTTASSVTPDPRFATIEDRLSMPGTMELPPLGYGTDSSTSSVSVYASPAEQETSHEHGPCLGPEQAGVASSTTTQDATLSETPMPKAETPGCEQRRRMLVREDTPEPPFDISSGVAVTSLTQVSEPVEEAQEDVSSASINFSCGDASLLMNQTFAVELEGSEPVEEAQEDLSSSSINFSCGDASLLMNQTFMSELEGSESAFPDTMAASSLDSTRGETLPSSTPSSVTLGPRFATIEDRLFTPRTVELPPLGCETDSSTSSVYTSPAEQEKTHECEPCLGREQAGVASSTTTQDATSSETPMSKAETPGCEQRPRVFVREDTPELSFDTSTGVASPGTTLSTPASMTYARDRSCDLGLKALHTAAAARTPLRECFTVSNSSSSPPSAADVPVPKSERQVDKVKATLQRLKDRETEWKRKASPRDQFNPYRMQRDTTFIAWV